MLALFAEMAGLVALVEEVAKLPSILAAVVARNGLSQLMKAVNKIGKKSTGYFNGARTNEVALAILEYHSGKTSAGYTALYSQVHAWPEMVKAREVRF